MRELIYYVATSVDGYIADKNGRVDWLNTFDGQGEDFGYHDFYSRVDSLIMGRATYEQVLGFGEWVYPGKRCWVMSAQKLRTDRDDIFITADTPQAVWQSIGNEEHQNTWLVGGGKVAQAFQNEGLITKFIVSIIPYLLGDGIPLVGLDTQEAKLQLTRSKTYKSGVVQLIYSPA